MSDTFTTIYSLQLHICMQSSAALEDQIWLLRGLCQSQATKAKGFWHTLVIHPF